MRVFIISLIVLALADFRAPRPSESKNRQVRHLISNASTDKIVSIRNIPGEYHPDRIEPLAELVINKCLPNRDDVLWCEVRGGYKDRAISLRAKPGSGTMRAELANEIIHPRKRGAGIKLRVGLEALSSQLEYLRKSNLTAILVAPKKDLGAAVLCYLFFDDRAESQSSSQTRIDGIASQSVFRRIFGCCRRRRE